jgi:hypothetical protein
MDELLFANACLELMLKYGIPAFIQIITAWEIEEPTVADIEALKNAVPEGKTYFEETPETPE